MKRRTYAEIRNAPNYHRVWTQGMKDAFAVDWIAGRTGAYMALKWQMKKGSVYRKRIDLGLPARNKRR